MFTAIAFESVAVGTALPTAARELDGLALYGWAFTALLAATVVGMVAAGRIGAVRGARGPLAAGLAIFAVGLLVAGVAGSMPELIAGRAIQGLGAGLLLTSAYLVIGTLYPEHLRPKMLAALATVWVVPALIGPLIAGLLAEHWTWRAVFLGLVPVIIGCGVLILPTAGAWTAPPSEERPRARRDDVMLGARTGAAALGVTGVAEAGQRFTAPSLALGIVFLALLAWGLRGLLPPGTFAVARGVGAGVAFRGILSGAFTGLEVLVPLMLTLQHGWSPTQAGIPLTATAVTWSLGSWWQGRRDHADRTMLVRIGFVLVLLGGAALALLSFPGAPTWLSVTIWPLAGIGAGLVMPSAGVILLGATTDATRGRDTAALHLSDSCAAALATSIGGALLAAAARGALSYTAAFAITAAVMCALAGLGALLAVRARPLAPR
ncbi:MAG: putative arabinose efflux permease, family [Pseudonocardiales bacterium]|nr:putative arabinose efflux permease, family [Pseudonocardiales bacterium]